MSRSSDADFSRVLPHRAPALLVSGALRAEGETRICTGRVPAASPWAREEAASSLLGLEMGAQAAALDAALKSGEGEADAARVGYVVGLRGVRVVEPDLPLERDLEVRIRLVGGAGELAIYEVSVRLEGREMVSGRVSVFVTDETL